MRYPGVFVAIAALSAPALMMAQDKDLTALSLEDFLKLEVVSVRKSQQKLSRTPAAVFVITQDDIRRSGATSLPEALRLAPGIHVGRVNGSAWAIGMRGFNSILSDKLLVMIDGRSIYNPVLSGVLWMQQMIPLEDIERIEVIRGPVGSMWGANAVSGVINIISRSAAATQGLLAAASTGTRDPARATVRYGAKLGEKLSGRTWFHYERNGQASITGVPQLDNSNTGRAGARFDWTPAAADHVTLQGEVNALRHQVNVTRYPSPLTVEVADARAGGTGGFLMGQWTHTNRRGDQSKLQIFGDIQSLSLGQLDSTVRTFDIDFQHSFSLPHNHTLLVGGGFRANALSTTGTPDLRFEPAGRTYLISNVFVSDEWQISPDRVVLTLGGKLEGYTVAGSTFQPSARLMWTPTPRQAYWAAVSGAVRVPSHVDYALRFRVGTNAGAALPIPLLMSGNEQLKPQRVRAVEAGVRWQLQRKAALELSLFQGFHAGITAYQTPFVLSQQNIVAWLMQGNSNIPAVAFNASQATTRGGEISIHYDLNRHARIVASYSGVFTAVGQAPGLIAGTQLDMLPNYPRHMAQLRTSWDVGRNWELDAGLYRTGPLHEGSRITLAGYSRVDCRIQWKASERTALFVSGQNLLHGRQQEFTGNTLFPVGSISRNIAVGLRWE